MKLFPEGIFFHGGQRHKVLRDLNVGPQEIRRQCRRTDLGDDEAPLAYLDKLSWIRYPVGNSMMRSYHYARIVGRPPGVLKGAGIIVPIHDAFPPPEDMRDWWRFVDWKHRRNLELVAQAA